jgi:uncharacterized protein
MEWMSSIANNWQNWVREAPVAGRLGWFALTWIGLWLPLAIPIARSLAWRPFAPLLPAQKLRLLGPLYLLAPLVLWQWLGAIHQGWDLYGWRWPLGLDVLLGWLVAIGSLIVVFGGEWLRGWLLWQGKGWDLLKAAVPIGLLALWISATEEVIFRGFLQVELEAWGNPWLAGIVASGIFALLHLVWERQQTLPQIPGLWLMGLVLTYAKFLDGGSLGLAIGLHAGWVWGLTCLDAAAAIQYSPTAPSWFIGLYQQPLAGLAGLIALIGTAGVLLGMGNLS